jgi:S-DNA-T family DNA segregation ATPase FtsK/SpoIIIE
MSAKKSKSKSKKQNVKKKSAFMSFIRSERTHFLTGVFLSFLSIYIFIGMVSFFFTGAADQSKVVNKYFIDLIIHKQDIANWTGVGGAFIAEALINNYFGIFTFVVPVFIFLLGARLMGVKRFPLIYAFTLCALVLVWGSIVSSFILSKLFPDSHVVWGGSHGLVLETLLENTIGGIGVLLVILLLLAMFFVMTKQSSIDFLRKAFQGTFDKDSLNGTDAEPFAGEGDEKVPLWRSFIERAIRIFSRKHKPEEEDDDDEDKDDDDITPPKPVAGSNRPDKKPEPKPVHEEDGFEIVVAKGEPEPEPRPVVPPVITTPVIPQNQPEIAGGVGEMEDYDPTKDLSMFHFPSLDLLKVYDSTGVGVDMDEQKANKEKIISTLNDYGIGIKSIKATVGPTITLYEIVPQKGVRISKIRNLEDDIALSLSALGIRIIAPMPGQGTIGIEVPNKDPQVVSMQSVIASQRFRNCQYDLPVALGKTITNEVFIFDLCKMPHLLVAGATGQGKSVGLNAIITSLLYKKHPAEMKMVLVDPKMVEFNIYARIEKHSLAKLPDAEKAIITDVSKVTQTLNSLTKEMDDRYELLMAANVRTIKEYNEKFKKRVLNPNKGHRFLPYIVVIIDEFGDLIMTAGKEIEMPIARIAQKARAVGIHMIIATQRPTTNIITGTIKANFPARMAFRVTSQIDSRTILDKTGANQLIGRGDMLFSQGGDLIRIQCAFVDTPEVEGITQYISGQQGYSHAFELPEYVGEGGGESKAGSMDLGDKDPLFEEAARLIVVHQQGSTSLIQRKFSIGFNRAGRLMDQLESAGIVGPTQGSKPREVFIADEYSLEQKLNSL